MHRNGEIIIKENESGVSAGIKMQYAVYIRCVAKPPHFKFQGGKLFNIFYFKLQYLSIRKMIKQGLYFRKVDGVW